MTSNTQRTQPRASPRSHRLRVWPALTAAVLLEAGCHILDVTNPDIVMPPSLNGSAALPTIRAGAIGDFAIGYSGSGAQGSGGTTEGQILLRDRKSTRLNSSHGYISYAVFCLKKKKKKKMNKKNS